jgi:parvulin-like peptidyl-prolyl isomerase
MIIYKRPIYTITLLFILIMGLLITGCAKKAGPETIVATINDYKMTVDDFNYESKEVLRTGKLIGEVPITKEDILDALITKEILLQEAQKENLDKDKNFMRTIELYWEQTLLKNLLTKKSKDIEKQISVYEDEIVAYYNKMKTKIKAKVHVFDDEKSARKLLRYSGDVTEYIEGQPEKFSLLYTVPSKWFILGQDNTSLENTIFSLSTGRDRDIVKISGNWALIIIEEKEPNEVKPLPTVRAGIAKNVRKIKEKELIDDWMDDLRSKARIRINKKVLEEIQ